MRVSPRQETETRFTARRAPSRRPGRPRHRRIRRPRRARDSGRSPRAGPTRICRRRPAFQTPAADQGRLDPLRAVRRSHRVAYCTCTPLPLSTHEDSFRPFGAWNRLGFIGVTEIGLDVLPADPAERSALFVSPIVPLALRLRRRSDGSASVLRRSLEALPPTGVGVECRRAKHFFQVR